MTSARDLKFVVLIVAFVTVLVTLLMKKGERIRGAAVLLGWLVPGAGHVLLGKWKKGLFFFSILGATYLFGLWIVGFRAISWEDNPFYYVGQWGSGATYLLAQLLSASGQKAYPQEGLHPSWFDPGLLYVCAVGLLNVVVVLNVLDVRRKNPVSGIQNPEASPPAAPPEGAAAPGGTA